MEQLERYLQKLLDIQQAQAERPLGTEELRQFATGMGISNADWQALQTTFNDHLAKGQGYLLGRNWDEAQAEFRQAFALAPHHLPGLFGLASAYAGRWQAHGTADDRRQAERFAQHCLRLDPAHTPAQNLLNQLKPSANRASVSGHHWQFVIAAVLLLALGGFGWWFLVKTPQVERDALPWTTRLVTPTPLPATSTPMIPTPTTQSTPTPIPTPGPPVTFTAGLSVPVSVTQDGNAVGLEFEVEYVRYIRHTASASSSYELAGWITFRGIEASHLVVAADFFGPAGTFVTRETLSVLRDYAPTMLSGDSVPMKFSAYSKQALPELSAVTLTVQEITKQPAPIAYAPFRPVAVKWLQHPPNFDLVIRERSMEMGEYHVDGMRQLNSTLVLEIQNTGKSMIRHIELEIQYLNLQGQPIEIKDSSLSRSPYTDILFFWGTLGDPAWKPGQIRAEKNIDFLLNTPRAQFQGYQITVVNIE